MSEQISIRELTTMAELNATVDLQRAVWGMHDAEAASPHTLRAIVHSGGAVFGAVARRVAWTQTRRSHVQKGERLVGFCFGFAAPRDGELWLWSHMAAVDPDLQGRGIGFRLKQAQRAWALKQGYRWMAWTFDPMQAGNANFNFNRLGVTARRYSADHYGEMQDGSQRGLGERPPGGAVAVGCAQSDCDGGGRAFTPIPGPFPIKREGEEKRWRMPQSWWLCG